MRVVLIGDSFEMSVNMLGFFCVVVVNCLIVGVKVVGFFGGFFEDFFEGCYEDLLGDFVLVGEEVSNVSLYVLCYCCNCIKNLLMIVVCLVMVEF